MQENNKMQLHILLIALAIFNHSQCQWTQTSRAKFCQKVFECAKDPTHQITPSADNNVLPENESKPTASPDDNLLHENETNTICMHALLCNKTSESTCDMPYSEVAIPEWFDDTNKTDLCTILNACTNSSTIHKYDDDHFQYIQNLSQYCPNTDYCGLTDSLSVPESVMTSCCIPCSCKPDCGLHHECCLASQDNYNVVEAEQMSCITLKTSIRALGFYMVDKCPDGSGCYKQGSVPYPVSSACTKRIYINKECARCNGNLSASDFITWQIAVGTQDFEQFMSLINAQTFYVAAYTIPPVHRVWVTHYSCGVGYEATCRQSRHNTQELLDACARVHAPVYIEQRGGTFLFMNVYCIMCSYGVDPRRYECQLLDGASERQNSLNMILDMEIIQAHTPQKDPCTDNNLALQRQVGCRSVLCPEWMLRVDGTCYYMTKQWNLVTVSAQLILRPNNQIPINLFQNMTNWDRVNVHTWLFNKCGLDLNQSKDTIRITLYMHPIEIHNVMVVKEFLLQMQHKFAEMKPSSLFRSIERCLTTGRWSMNRDNSNYYLSASLYSYKSFLPDGTTRRSHISLNKSLIESPLPRIYKRITSSPRAAQKSQGKPVIPTKLAYCERVELSLEDVELLFGQIRVRNTGKVLGDSEFGVQYERLDGEDRLINVHVCLEDFVKTVSSAGASKVDQYIGVGSAFFVASFVWKL